MSQTDNALIVHGGIKQFVSATAGVGRGLPVYILQSEATVVVDVNVTNMPALVGSSWGKTPEATVAGSSVELANIGDPGEVSWLVAVVLVIL